MKKEFEAAFFNLELFLKIFCTYPNLRYPIAELFPEETKKAANKIGFDDYLEWEETLSEWEHHGEEEYKKDFHALIFAQCKNNKIRRKFINQLFVLLHKQVDMGWEYLNDEQQVELIKSITADPKYKTFME